MVGVQKLPPTPAFLGFLQSKRMETLETLGNLGIPCATSPCRANPALTADSQPGYCSQGALGCQGREGPMVMLLLVTLGPYQPAQ